jgi:hypothetical protein
MDVTTITFHTQRTLNPKNSLKQILDLLQRLSKPTSVKTKEAKEDPYYEVEPSTSGGNPSSSARASK